MHPYSSIDMTMAWKKLRFILSVRSDIHMTDSVSIAVHAFASGALMFLSVDKALITRQVNFSTSFRELPFSVEMSPLWLKYVFYVLSELTWKPMPAAARSRLCSWVSAWVGVFARSAMSASVIVCARHLLLLSFASLKPLYFIISIDVLSPLSRKMINRYGANVSPCSTHATMSK